MQFDDLVADATELDDVTEAKSVAILFFIGASTVLFVPLALVNSRLGAHADWLASNGTRRRVLVVFIGTSVINSRLLGVQLGALRRRLVTIVIALLVVNVKSRLECQTRVSDNFLNYS